MAKSNRLHLPTLAKSMEMTGGSGMSIDYSEFKRGLERLTITADKALKIGLQKAGEALLHDAVYRSPTVPIKEGILRASGSAFVGNRLVKTTEDLPSKRPGQPAKTIMGAGRYDAHVGFNMVYAKYQHEGHNFQFSDPRSGAYYLRYKVLAFPSQYKAVLARAFKNELENDGGVGNAP